MALLEILRFPDKRLRIKATPVERVDKEVLQIVEDMFETMYDAPGIGLAATQVNIHRQIVVMDISEQKDQPLCLINPKILASEGVEKLEEGCLSVPDYHADVERAKRITIQALDQQGEVFELVADELLAICIQHEMDHLQGKLFVDYLSPLKRYRLQKKIEKLAKQK
ncbi:MAG: peptide deformylase [Cocleimonas sp.]|nr:peptide deformylase [Cocleimonas sp.]